MEDLAGVIVVLIIVGSAIVAGYEAIHRLLHPQPITFLGWVVAAGLVGFVGNEWVAVFRIRVGRDINSVALIADGYHARTDGLTSLAVVLGALGVWLGFPAADPLIGLVITAMIFGIVWQSAQAVFTRLLDGVDPAVIEEIKHAVQHTPEVQEVTQVRVGGASAACGTEYRRQSPAVGRPGPCHCHGRAASTLASCPISPTPSSTWILWTPQARNIIVLRNISMTRGLCIPIPSASARRRAVIPCTETGCRAAPSGRPALAGWATTTRGGV